MGKADEYEFFGPIGTFFISISVAYFSYFFGLGCSEAGCTPRPLNEFFGEGLLKYSTTAGWASLWDTEAAIVYALWYLFCVVCWIVLPGKWIEGVKLRDDKRLKYKINAFATFIVTNLLLIGGTAAFGLKPLTFVYDHWTGLVTASLLNSIFQACYVQFASYGQKKMLAEGGDTRNSFYNWFIGRELNPRIGSFDIKSFNELRPGMILWFVIDIAMAAKQYTDIGRITDSMALVVVFQSIYVFDALYNEPAIFTTMDIISDGFGFMLSVGDLVWVPFTYSLQARYLASFPKDLGLVATLAICAVNLVGYYIFRVSNLEKNDFRNGNNPKNLHYMQTKRGTKLLTSGWWGRSRHPNYLGDWLMAWAWCLPCGFDTPIPYFYVIYFAILLIHRQKRDDAHCREKYGADWDKYCKLVSSRIVPGIY